MRNILIFFALMLLVLVGAAYFLGNPSGTQDAIFSPILETIAGLELNEDELRACVDENRFADQVQEDVDQGNSLNITGTPTIFLLNRETGKSVRASGAYPFEPLKASIDRLLADDIEVGESAYENQEVGINMIVEDVEGIDIHEGDNLRGTPEARIALIEYSDFDCQFCARFHATAYMLGNEFSGDLIWAYRHFPISTIHPNAFNKAQLSECVKDQAGIDAFWAVVDAYLASILN